VELDDSVSTAQAQAAGLAGDIGSSYADDVASGSAGDFPIGLDPNRISDDMFTNYVNAGSSDVTNVFDLGGGVGDFGFGTTRSQNFLNPELAELYKQQEMARTGVNLNKNPFVDSMFTNIFGDLIDRRKDLGSQRIQEINDLRARQAFGLPSLKTGKSYTSKDFELGRDTNQGMVKELPMGGLESFARSFTPYGSMLPTRAAPERSQMYREAQAKANAPGIMGLVGRGLNSIFGEGIDFLNNSKAGTTAEEVAKEQARVEIADLEEQRQNQLTDIDFRPMSTTVDKVELDPAFMDVGRTKSKDSGASLAVDPNLSPEFVSRMRSIDALPAYSAVPQPVMVNQLQRDIAKSRGIFDLPQAADLQNNQIAAGSSTGQTLSSGPMSGGYTLSPISSTGSIKDKDKVAVQGPPEPTEKAPPGYVDIVMSENISPRFAGTNMSIYGGKGPGESFKPKSELEAQAAIDAGFSLAPFTPMFEKTFNPRDYTSSGIPVGVNLPAAEFRFNRQPEVTTRFKISDLPREVQEIVGLKSNLDYASRAPISMKTILDGKRAVEKGEFPEQEMTDFLGGFGKYSFDKEYYK